MKKGFLKDYELDAESKSGYRYVGIYYSCTVPAENRKKHGSLQLAGGILELAVLMCAVSIRCLGNFKISVVIPAECILLCTVLYLTGAYAYRNSPDRMEKGTYEKVFLRTVQTVAVGLFLNIFSVVAQVIVIIQNRQELEGYGDYLLLGALLLLCIGNFMALKYHRGLYKTAGPITVEAGQGDKPHEPSL